MKLNLLILYIIIGFVNNISCQYICDTIYSGIKWEYDISQSITKELQSNLIKKELCSLSWDEGDDPKVIVPFYLNKYKKSIKDYDVIIYTLMCDYNSAPISAITFEIFFDSEEKAKVCLNNLDHLKKKLLDDWNHDRIPKDQTDLGGTLFPNWFFIQKGKVVYFIHRFWLDTEEEPVVKVLSEELNKVLEK